MELWDQAEGDQDQYIQKMREHGYIVAKDCGCKGRCSHQNLPCGWPGVEDER